MSEVGLKPLAGFKEPGACSVSACGKVILCGEHAVVYGSHAVAIPLLDMKIDLALAPSHAAKEPSVTMKMADRQMTQRVADVFLEACELLGLEKFPVSITGDSSLPIGSGVGSSAALCVGALRGLAASYSLSLSRETLGRLGNALEKRFHGNPSGLDTAVVAYESSLLFKKGEPVDIRVLSPKRSFSLALIDSGVPSSTKAMIQLASPFFRNEGGERRLALFDDNAVLTAKAIEQGSLMDLAFLIGQCGEYLAQLGVVTDSLREIMDVAVGFGCLAAKTTGAGGGGVVLALLDPDKELDTLCKLRDFFGAGRVYSVSLSC